MKINKSSAEEESTMTSKVQDEDTSIIGDGKNIEFPITRNDSTSIDLLCVSQSD